MHRRAFSSSEKVQIVLASMGEGVIIKDLCAKYKVPRSTLYTWRKRFMTFASSCFSVKAKGNHAKHP